MTAVRSLLRRARPEPAFEQVLLVIPPSIFLLDERVFPSLGILRVASALEAADVDVHVLDLSGIENYEDATRAALAAGHIRCAGITATTPQMPAVAKIVAVIRETSPSTRVILGGPHPTLVHAAVRGEKKRGVTLRAHRAMTELERLADVLVAGDGEAAIFEALTASPSKLVDGDDPKGDLFMKDADYEATPWPARHLIDMNSYHYEVDGSRATSVIAQLGCPRSHSHAPSAVAETAVCFVGSALEVASRSSLRWSTSTRPTA